MSHEIVGLDRRHVYTMPAWPSDVLRSREFSLFFKSYRGASFSVQTRDGWRWFSCPLRRPVFTASFSTREKLDAVITASSEDALARIFLDGDLDVQGDIFALLSVAEYVLRHSSGFSRSLVQTLSRASSGWLKVLKGGAAHSPPEWRSAICPSNLSVHFFEPWLGESLGHGCGRFRSPNDGLAAAQAHALEGVCAALELGADDRLLDLSCGWGTLLLHVAARYGIETRGVAASEQQAAIANERMRCSRLERLCSVSCRDLARPLNPANTFPKIADIGLFDPVLASHFQEFLTHARALLAPGGLLLLHRVTRSPRPPRHSASSRTSAGPRHPDTPRPADLASLSDELQLAESLGFHLLKLEDLGDDLRHTLRLWIEPLQWMTQSPGAAHYRDYRSWLFHLLDTATNLEAGSVQFHQIVLRGPDSFSTGEASSTGPRRPHWSH